jgi:pimeloyl-ACP methyl ester carboxylesterase
VDVPTLVLWGLQDTALLPELLDGLEDYVPRLSVQQVPDASHWIVHEQPQLVAQRLGAFLRQ